MNKRNLFLMLYGIIVVVIATLLIGLSSHGVREDKVTIGVILPLSADLADFGESIKRGIDLATNSFPANSFEVIYEDTQGLAPRGAVTAFNKLRSVDKADIIIGPVGPEQTLAVAPRLKGSEEIIFAISLCDQRFQEYPDVFCSFPSIEDQVRAGGELIDQLNITSVFAIVENSALGETFLNALRKEKEARRFDIVGVERVASEGTDFRSSILKAIESKAEAVYIVLVPDPAHLILNQLYQLGFQGRRLMGTDTTEERLLTLGEAAEGVYIPGFISEQYESRFVNIYKEHFGKDPDLYPALGHSITYTVLKTLELQGWNPQRLREQIANQMYTETAIPGFVFESDRTVNIPATVFQFKDGKLTELP